MRFPLLVNASPSIVQNGPYVLVRPGKWKVDSDHRDSTVHVFVGDSVVDNKEPFEVTEPKSARVHIATIGREKEINVFLVSV